jgi:hypothetical protein
MMSNMYKQYLNDVKHVSINNILMMSNMYEQYINDVKHV